MKEYINTFIKCMKFGFELTNRKLKKAMNIMEGLNLPLKELAFSQIPTKAMFESSIEATL